jgi:hypothetical protein
MIAASGTPTMNSPSGARTGVPLMAAPRGRLDLVPDQSHSLREDHTRYERATDE